MTSNDLKKLRKEELIELINRTKGFADRMAELWEEEECTASDKYLRTYYKACRETYETILKKMDTFCAEAVESKEGGF